jgi:hypothetical protein
MNLRSAKDIWPFYVLVLYGTDLSCLIPEDVYLFFLKANCMHKQKHFTSINRPSALNCQVLIDRSAKMIDVIILCQHVTMNCACYLYHFYADSFMNESAYCYGRLCVSVCVTFANHAKSFEQTIFGLGA